MRRSRILRAVPDLPIRLKLILAFLAVIGGGGIVSLFIGTRIMHRTIISLAQDKVRHDLSTAWMVYNQKLQATSDVIRTSAGREALRDALATGNLTRFAKTLDGIRRQAGLDILTLTDAQGKVVLRARRPENSGEDRSADPLVARALQKESPAATAVLSRAELLEEGADLADRARIDIVPTPMAEDRPETREDRGFVLEAASPVTDGRGTLLGVLYGAVLLNRNYEIVDKVKDLVFENERDVGGDIGAVTIFQGDLRIATNVRDAAGARAVGTRVSREVGRAVLGEGRTWADRAFVVTDWYITAYDPIRDAAGRIVGMLCVGLLEKPYLDRRDAVMGTFTGLATLCALVLLLILTLLTLGITRPLRAMVEATEKIAQGELDHRLGIESRDEVGRLARSFDRMTEDLRKANATLVESARSLERRVEERTRELRKMQDHMVQSEKLAALGKIAAGVAHEINNPLTSILINTHLMLEQEDRIAPFRENLTLMAEEIAHCVMIVKRLLDFARQTPPCMKRVGVNELIERVGKLIEVQAGVRNIRIAMDLFSGLPVVELDRSQIQQVLWNLTINALEAMPDGGTLTLRSRPGVAPGAVEVEIADTGVGIPRENLTRLFDPFFTTKSTGTGLGLAVTYGIIERHGGTIEVKSEVGRGSAFTLIFPAVKEGGPDAGYESETNPGRG